MRPESAVADDQVRPNVRAGLDAHDRRRRNARRCSRTCASRNDSAWSRHPGGCTEPSRSPRHARRGFAGEGASPLHLLDQVMRDMSELCGEVLVNVENVHVERSCLSSNPDGGVLRPKCDFSANLKHRISADGWGRHTWLVGQEIPGRSQLAPVLRAATVRERYLTLQHRSLTVAARLASTCDCPARIPVPP